MAFVKLIQVRLTVSELMILKMVGVRDLIFFCLCQRLMKCHVFDVVSCLSYFLCYNFLWSLHASCTLQFSTAGKSTVAYDIHMGES